MIAGCSIDDECCTLIARGLKANGKLRGLNLARNKIAAVGANELADALLVNKMLLKIHLSMRTVIMPGVVENPIDEKGWECFGSMLCKNETLKWLNLAGTRGGEAGCKFLSEALKRNKSLRVLNIYDTGIGAAGCKLVADGVEKNSALKNLWLGTVSGLMHLI